MEVGDGIDQNAKFVEDEGEEENNEHEKDQEEQEEEVEEASNEEFGLEGSYVESRLPKKNN